MYVCIYLSIHLSIYVYIFIYIYIYIYVYTFGIYLQRRPRGGLVRSCGARVPKRGATERGGGAEEQMATLRGGGGHFRGRVAR